MTPWALTAVLGVGLTVLALAGPWLLRRAAPALVRLPRLAILVVGGGVLVWLGGLLAIGPVLTWVASGPTVLPEDAAAACQRCLAAANPYPGSTAETVLPTVLLLALPTALALILGGGIARQMVRRRRRSRDAARQLLRGAHRRRLLGYAVSIVDVPHPFALTFPDHHGGIILSTAALHALDEEELAAVLAHEHAHLRQRHHLIAALMASTAVVLRWVPLVAAAADAIPHYLEIAADDHARRRAGTPALVGALVKLGGGGDRPGQPASCAEALHAAGPHRIGQLVRPSTGITGAGPAVAIAAYLLTLGVVSAAVHLPYASAALTGCA